MKINNFLPRKMLNRNIKNQNNIKKSFNRLSTGKRINSASDDSAGLSISQRKKGQLNGIGQAQKNIQDGISLLQTAEGGLKEINSSLQRMRELSVQAANDTLTDKDREGLQNEFSQLKNNILTIAKETSFNGKNLLNKNHKLQNVTSPNEISDNKLNDSPPDLKWEKHLPSDVSINSIELTNDGDYIVGGNSGGWKFRDSNSWLAKINQNGELVWEKDLDRFDDYNRINDISKLDQDKYVAIAESNNDRSSTIAYIFDSKGNILESSDLYHATNDVLYSIESKGDSFVGSGTQISSLVIEQFDSDLESEKRAYKTHDYIGSYYGYDIQTLDNGGYMVVGEESFTNDPNKGFAMKFDEELNSEPLWEVKMEEEAFTSVKQTNSGDYLALGQKGLYKIDSNGENINIINDNINYNVDTRDFTGDTIRKTDDGNFLIGASEKMHKVDNNGDIIWEKEMPSGENLVRGLQQTNENEYISIQKRNSIAKFSHTEETTEPDEPDDKNKKKYEDLVIQTGPNSGDNFNISLERISTKTLNINDTSIETQEKANLAIEDIDNAINLVNSERANVGSQVNALEHTNNNLYNYQSNISDSLSQIEDADIADEIMNLTKEQIIQESNISALLNLKNINDQVLEIINYSNNQH
ncbi:flagellin [Natranaerobius trueperi]|uniref:Flagellin n=1 Tax=Natranaerobius trueperi TaxID=759412 RepID=A0A226BX44_9FIRM|nr:flagellin [Natranaerobius trueperi]OWZ83352.1 hypothetical protein CDO51_09030 [Natranaerobius trueperi]